MKAAQHGSPPLARPNRHHSNSSYGRMKSNSRSNSLNPKMPPFLRLDSAGEATSHDGPHKIAGHQRTNTCRQGPEPNAGVMHGKNGFFGKLMSNLGPQSSSSSCLLDSSRFQDSISLDELINSKKMQSSLLMAEKPGPAHVKMAHTNFPVSHVNKYGQWRTKPHVGPSYPFLPRGVFPCHVFQAVHSQRETRDMRGPTSGQFVINDYSINCMSAFTCSLLDAWRFPPGTSDSSNSSQKTESDSESSVSTENSARSCDSEKLSAPQIRTTTCGGSVRNFKCSAENMATCLAPKMNIAAGNIRMCPAQKRDTGVSSSFTGYKSRDCDTVLNVKNCPTTSSCLQLCKKSLTSSTDTSDSNFTESEHSNFVSQRATIQPPKNDQSTATKSGEEGEDQLLATSGKAGEQSLADDDVDWDESEEDSDGEDDPGCGAADAEESEPEDWACFMACPLSLSNLLSNPSKKQPKCGEGAEESGGQERRVAKPCRAVTNRWRLVYSAEPPSDRQCKVRFECGRGKDTVHEFEKGEGETLTVMEVQKARDLIKHHGQNAAKLLQQTSVDSDEDEEEGGSRGGESPGEAPAEPKSKTAEYVLALLSSLQHVRDSTDSMNSSSNESDVEDEEDAKNVSDDEEDDDDVVFQEEDCDIVFVYEDEKNDDDDDNNKHINILIICEDENDEEGDDDIVFE